MTLQEKAVVVPRHSLPQVFGVVNENASKENVKKRKQIAGIYKFKNTFRTNSFLAI
jgi:hypothetical protein